jgi:hypothetical protein
MWSGPLSEGHSTKQKSKIFGTFNTQLWHKLPGGVPVKPHLLKEFGIDPEKEACLLKSQLEGAFCQYIIEVYARLPHRGLGGNAPEQVWRKREPIDLIEIADDIASLEASFGRVVDATLTREGVTINGLQYHREKEVRELLRDLLPMEPIRGRARNTVKVKAKIHPDNLGVVHVLNHKQHSYVALPCTQPKYVGGISEHHHNVLKVYAQKEGMNFQTEAERVEVRARLADTIDSFIPVRIKHRKQIQRVKGVTAAEAAAELVSDGPRAPSSRSQYESLIDAISDRADGRQRFKSAVRSRKRHSPARRTIAAADESAGRPEHRPAITNDANEDRSVIMETAERLDVARDRVRTRRNAG